MTSSEVVAFIDEYEDESDKDMVAALIHAQKSRIIFLIITYKIFYALKLLLCVYYFN